MTCTSCLTYCIIYCFPRPQSDSGMFVEHHGYSFFRSKYCSAICYQHFPEIRTTTTPHWTAFDLLQLCGFYFSFSLSFSFSKLGRLNCFLPVFDRILNIYISIYFDSFSSSSHFTLNHTFGYQYYIILFSHLPELLNMHKFWMLMYIVDLDARFSDWTGLRISVTRVVYERVCSLVFLLFNYCRISVLCLLCW